MRVLDLRVVGHALAGVEERQRELAQRQLGLSWKSRIALAASITEPPPTATIRSGSSSLEDLDAGADLLLGRLGLDVGEHVHAGVAEVAAHLVDDAARLGSASVTSSTGAACSSRRLSSAPALK